VKEGTGVLVGLGAGLAGGIAIGMSQDAGWIRAADAVAPVGTLWVNAIRMTVIPLIVSLLVTGVASVSDLSTIGRIGGRTVAVFFTMLAAAAVLALPLGIATFAWLSNLIAVPPELPPGATDAAKALAGDTTPVGFSSWLTSLVPTNPVAAAANGAMLPLILFTLLLALAIARCPKDERDVLLRFFGALKSAMLVLVRWIVRLAPIGVFALMLPLGAHGGARMAGAVGFYVVAYSAASLLFVLLLYPAIAVLGRVPLRSFSRALLPAQLIAFSSSSSIASLPAQVRGAEEGLRLPKDVTGFVLPLAVSTFKFAAPVSWMFGALFVAWFYRVDLDASAYATLALATVFLGFAAPGVPRGAFLMLAPLFLALHLPVEGIGILIAVDAIPDLFATVLNASGDFAATVLVARFAGAAGAVGACGRLRVPSAPSAPRELGLRLLEDLRELERVDAPSGHEADGRPALLERGFDRRGRRERAGALDDEMVRAREQPDRRAHALLGDEDDVVDEVPQERKHLLGDVGNRDAVAHRAALDGDGLARADRVVERRAAARFDGDDAHRGLDGSERARDARDQATSADRHVDRVDLRALLEDLEAERRVAEDHVAVRPGMDERVRLRLPPVLAQVAEHFRRRNEHGCSAERANGFDLGDRRVLRHQAARRDAELPSAPGERLGGVPRADRAQAAATVFVRESEDGVVDAADLEGAGGLEDLGLQEDLEIVPAIVQPHERRADDDVADASGGRLEFL
jgi:Na+/H+-dicarboxylate symporter